MNEEEIRRIARDEFDKFAENYYRRNYPGFNITSGHNTMGHGVSEYVMSTDTAQGIHFYKQGNGKLLTRKSFELVTGDKATDKDVAISIRAQDGHIVIEAKNGDLTLRGGNIILETTDAEGSIVSKPAKVFHVKAPEVELESTKMTAIATMDMMMAAGELTMYAESGPPSMVDGTEPIVGGGLIATLINALNKAQAYFRVNR